MEAWGKFEAFLPLHECKVQKQMADTRWVLTWEMVEGEICVEARLAAKGFQDPNLKDGLVETSGCVSLRSSHHQVISLNAIRNWELWSLGIKNAFLQAGEFERDVFLHSPSEWDPPCEKRARKLKAPAYGLNDAPAAFRRSLKRHILNSDLSVKNAELRRMTSAFDPCPFFVFRDQGREVGAFATHIDDILGCGEPDVLPKIRRSSGQRFGAMKLQETSFVHVGVELNQNANFSAALKQEEFAKDIQPLGTSPELRALQLL